MNAKNGETIWIKNRNTRNGWATPAVVEHEGKVQVITGAPSRPEAGNRMTPGKVIDYDLENGNVIWECSGLTDNAIPCPIVENGVAYCMTGYQGFSLLAVPIFGKGEQSKNILWRRELGTPYVPSPILYDGLLYSTQSNQAMLSCVDAKTGEVLMEQTDYLVVKCLRFACWSWKSYLWSDAMERPRCSRERGSLTWLPRIPWPTALTHHPRW